MTKVKIKNLFIFFLVFLSLFPLTVMVFKSLQGTMGNITLEQYGRTLFQTEKFMRSFWNSVIYTVVIIAINLPVSLLAAYGFTQFDFRGRKTIFWGYIVLMLMPFQATIVPQYLTLKALNILNTPKAVILPNAFSTFGTFLIAQYMRGIDKEIFEAGRIDGHNEFRLMVNIAMPICRPLLSALTVLLFINYWSMVEQPLIFLTKQQLQPLSVLLSGTDLFRKITYACGFLFTLLPLLLYLLSYEDLVQGIALSSSTGNIKTPVKMENFHEGKGRAAFRKAIFAFLAIMLVLTLVTQKITYMMTPKVEVISPRNGALMEIPRGKDSEPLGYFSTIVPAACVFSEGSENYLFLAMKDINDEDKFQAVKVSVTITAQNGIETAVSGGIPGKAAVIRYTTRPLIEGNYIHVLQWGNENE